MIREAAEDSLQTIHHRNAEAQRHRYLENNYKFLCASAPLWRKRLFGKPLPLKQ
jgi:hypothetical protein